MQGVTVNSMNFLQSYATDAAKLTAPGVRLWLRTNFSKVPHTSYVGTLAAQNTAQEIAILSKYKFGSDVLLLLSMVPTVSLASVVTTFNVSELLCSCGFHCELVEVQDCEKMFGDTLKEGMDRKEFPTLNAQGFMRFSNGVQSFLLPIEGMFLNTNYFKDTKFERKQFVKQLAELVMVCSTFFSMTNGVVKFTNAAEAGVVLLDFPELLQNGYLNVVGAFGDFLQETITSMNPVSERAWSQTTAHAGEFSHLLYMGLLKRMKEDDKCMGYVQYFLNSLIRPVVRNGRGVPYFEYENSVMRIMPVLLRLPHTMAGRMLNFAEKAVTLEQAKYALQLSRTFRGENKAKKGALSRLAYVNIGVHDVMAESIYMASNLFRLARISREIAIIAESAKSTNLILSVLQALTILDYMGVLLVPNLSGIKSCLKEEAISLFTDKTYTYGNAKFIVYMGDTEKYFQANTYLKREGYYFPSDESIILDLRPNKVTYDRTKFEAYNQNQAAMLTARMQEWLYWGRPVVSRCECFSGMFDKAFKEVQFTSGVELHNLVMWTGYKCDLSPRSGQEGLRDDWWYLVDGPLTLHVVCTASVLVTIARCTRALNHIRVDTLLDKMKFKVPRLRMSGLGRLNVNIIAYTNVNIDVAISQGYIGVSKLFAESSNVDRAVMLSRPDVAQILTQKPDVLDIQEGEGSSSSIAEPIKGRSESAPLQFFDEDNKPLEHD